MWVDLDSPTTEEARILSDVFHFHELAIEDAMSEAHHPKVESYGDYLYLILHGIDFAASEHCFTTQGRRLLSRRAVPRHGAPRRLADPRPDQRTSCDSDARLLGEGPGVLMYRIIDTMIDNYRPEVEKLEAQLDEIEKRGLRASRTRCSRGGFSTSRRTSRRCARSCCRSATRSARLARREFPLVNEALAYRFRDVHDHLVRLSDEAMFFQDRITSILDAHLSSVSNQLNSVMKVLTIIATLFMPLTVFTGMWGMNVTLPHLPGRRARAVLVGLRHHARGVGGHARVLPPQGLDLGRFGNLEIWESGNLEI